MVKKVTPIKYTSRDFDSIKGAIVTHAKRYFPDTFQDFSDASFGALMVDAVSYVGDVLSFYLDYQANESFLDTAVEANNVIKIAKQMGYKFRNHYSSTGIVSLFIRVPKVSGGYGPDPNYLPILKRGTTFSTPAGNTFTLSADVDFSVAGNRVVVATVNTTTGEPTAYAVRAYGEIVSGEYVRETTAVGNFIPLRRVYLSSNMLTEMVSVFDSEGHEYFEVDYLSQDIVYRSILNRIDTSSNAPKYMLKPKSVPRRFTIEYDENNELYLQFGYGSDNTLRNESLKSASDVVLKRVGRNYESSPNFDPSSLVETDKLGVGPSDTTLTITYRKNSRDTVNAPANSINTSANAIFEFSTTNINSATQQTVQDSLEVNNASSIVGDVSLPSLEEIKIRAKDAYATQNRAVTKLDYESLAYRMPPKFGSVKRCAAAQDRDATRRNLNLYVLSENSSGYLTASNQMLKNNLKTWLIGYKMINDTIDILDGRILNLGINFTLRASPDKNRFEVLQQCVAELQNYYSANPFDIGEPLYINDIYKRLNRLDGVIDVTNVKTVQKTGTGYSNLSFNIQNNMSPDGTILYVPEDTVIEIKYFAEDIKGTIR
jgi:hypothetical protein